jgi:hypothetical protein
MDEMNGHLINPIGRGNMELRQYCARSGVTATIKFPISDNSQEESKSKRNSIH